ncbi:hypothetical protein [Streptomyces zhihengii]
MTRTYGTVAVRRLVEAVDELAPTVSATRARQLRMVVGMWDRAVARDDFPQRKRLHLAHLFSPEMLAAFWALAEEGELRHHPDEVGRPLSVATLRIVRDCLGILARRVVPGRDVRLPVVEGPGLHEPVDDRARTALFRELVDLAGRSRFEEQASALLPESRARLLAMIAVVLDTGAREGELAALRMTDLAPGLRAVAVRRRPQRGAGLPVDEIAAAAFVDPRTVWAALSGQVERMSEATRQRILAAAEEVGERPEVEWYELRPGTRVALERWLEVREELMSRIPVEGSRSALWVTVVTTGLVPVGVTLQASGLRQAYMRGIAVLNVLMAGAGGWEPLPTRLEQLRRSVDAVPLLEPPAGAGRGPVAASFSAR